MADNPLKRALDKLTKQVIDLDGISGTAITTDDGEPCLKVYLRSADAKGRSGIPKEVGGYRVLLEETGSFRRL